MKIKIIALVALAAGLTCTAQPKKSAPVQLPPPADKEGVTYATDIKPLFDRACIACHSGDKAKARLKLDSHEGALTSGKGGKGGNVIKPGNSAESRVVRAMGHTTKERRPGVQPLTVEEVGLIRAWIDQGAK